MNSEIEVLHGQIKELFGSCKGIICLMVKGFEARRFYPLIRTLQQRGYGVILHSYYTEWDEELPPNTVYINTPHNEVVASFDFVDLFICPDYSAFYNFTPFKKGAKILLLCHDPSFFESYSSVQKKSFRRVLEAVNQTASFYWSPYTNSQTLDFLSNEELSLASPEECISPFDELGIIPGGYFKYDLLQDDPTVQGEAEKLIVFGFCAIKERVETDEEFATCTNMVVSMIKTALDAAPDHKVVVRFHPCSEDDKLIEPLLADLIGSGAITVDTSKDGSDIFDRATIVISDFSSVAFNFSIIKKRHHVMFNMPSSMELFSCSDYKVDNESEFGIKTGLGFIVFNNSQLANAIKHASSQIENLGAYKYILENVPNYMKCANYLADNLHYFLEPNKHPDWLYLKRN